MRAMLFEENLLVLSPQLAVAVGLNEAIVLQQMHYWLKKTRIIVDGRPWVYNTFEEWAEQFPFWSVRTIRNVFDNLRKGELIESRKLASNAWDKTNYYTIRYSKLEDLGVLFAPAVGVPGGDENPGGSGCSPQNTDEAKSGASNGANPRTDEAKSGASKRQKSAHRSGSKRRIEAPSDDSSHTETTAETTAETLTGQAPEGATPALEGELLQAERKPEGPRLEIPADMPGPKDRNCKTFRAWANYAFAYRKRYEVWPAWNAQAGGMLGKLIDRIGADLAPKVAAFYIGINDARLIRECHPLSLLLQGCEGYRTQYLTGRQMNGTTARQLEATQANANAAAEAARQIREGEGGPRNAFL